MPECALTESQWYSTALDSPHGQPEVRYGFARTSSSALCLSVIVIGKAGRVWWRVVASLGYEVQSVTPPVLQCSILSYTNAILHLVKLTRWGLCWGLSPSVRYVFTGKPAAARASQKVGMFITYELMGWVVNL